MATFGKGNGNSFTKSDAEDIRYYVKELGYTVPAVCEMYNLKPKVVNGILNGNIYGNRKIVSMDNNELGIIDVIVSYYTNQWSIEDISYTTNKSVEYIEQVLSDNIDGYRKLISQDKSLTVYQSGKINNLKDYEVLAIKTLWFDGISGVRDISKFIGVSESDIRDVLNGTLYFGKGGDYRTYNGDADSINDTTLVHY